MNNSVNNQAGREGVVRIILVDDHPLLRLSLREVLKRESNMLVVGEAEDREPALALIEREKPDLAIVDITLKSSNGIDLIRDLRERFPKLLTLVLSMHDETVHAERAIRAGAGGYITKQEATRSIMDAIHKVLKGEIYWSQRAASLVASKVARSPGHAKAHPMDTLTDRELQVFELIGSGQSTRQIGATLHINVSTVETYRARIKDKLALEDSYALLQSAIRWHIAKTNGGK